MNKSNPHTRRAWKHRLRDEKARKTSRNLAIMKARLAIIEMNVSVLDYTIVTTYKILYVAILVQFSHISRGGAFLPRPFPIHILPSIFYWDCLQDLG